MNLEQKILFLLYFAQDISPKLVENHDVETSKTGRLSTEGQGGKDCNLLQGLEKFKK